jgi:hypothetical protein
VVGLLFWHTHADECPEQATGGCANRGPTQDTRQDPASNDRTDTGDQPGSERTKDAADDPAGQQTTRRARASV